MTSTSDKKHLRRLGHNLKPVVIIASKGLARSVNAEINRALNDHELIKIKFSLGDRLIKKQLSEEICQSQNAELIQSIGNMLLIFRRTNKPDPKLSNLLRQ
jgi:RNA-binding protein